jgi:hypothetical protein
MEFNYASVEIEKEDDDIKVLLNVRSYDNENVM